MMKIGLDMEQTLGSPGEEKRERERGAAELLRFSTRRLWCVGKASRKVAGGQRQSKECKYLPPLFFENYTVAYQLT